MIENFRESHKDTYNEYDFERITHEDALYIRFKIIELELCKECISIGEIENIKTKCTEILDKLDKYSIK